MRGPRPARCQSVLALACATLSLASAVPAAARPDAAAAQAKALFKQAEIHFSLGEFPEALAKYKQAYEAKPLPAFLFNIGQCHRNMKECDKALFFYKQYLVRDPRAKNRADVEKLISICEAEVARQEPEPAPPASVPTSAPAAREPRPPTPPAAPARRGLRPAWFWASAALAGALLVTGTVTGALALDRSSEYKDPATSIETRRDLKDTGEDLRTVSTATMIAGGAVAVGAAVLLLFTDFGGEKSVAAAPLEGGAALSFQGSF